jgi:hypothetical protein
VTLPDIRERLLDVISFTECANQGTTPDALLDAYRNQVLTEGAELVRTWHDRLPGEHECCDGNAAELLLATRAPEEA